MHLRGQRHDDDRDVSGREAGDAAERARRTTSTGSCSTTRSSASRCRAARGSISSRTTTTRRRTGTTRIRPRPVRFGEASTAEMMFGMFEFTAAAGVSPKPSTERSRLTALLSSFPADSAFLIEVPFAKEPTLSVFHLPRSGDGVAGTWTTFGRLIGPGPVQQLKWDGERVRVPDRAARRARRRLLHRHRHGRRRRRGQGHDASGEGTRLPPSYDFTGKVR